MVCELNWNKTVRKKMIELKGEMHKCPFSVIHQTGRKPRGVIVDPNSTAQLNLQISFYSGVPVNI